MDSSQQMEDRLTTTERELLKVRGEKERIVRENTQLQHAKTSIEEEMRTTIQEYEEKLHLVEKFLKIKSKVHQIDSILNDYQETDSRKMAEEIRKISGEIIEEL